MVDSLIKNGNGESYRLKYKTRELPKPTSCSDLLDSDELVMIIEHC